MVRYLAWGSTGVANLGKTQGAFLLPLEGALATTYQPAGVNQVPDVRTSAASAYSLRRLRSSGASRRRAFAGRRTSGARRGNYPPRPELSSCGRKYPPSANTQVYPVHGPASAGPFSCAADAMSACPNLQKCHSNEILRSDCC